MSRRVLLGSLSAALVLMFWGNAAGFLPVGKFAYELVRPLGTPLSSLGQSAALELDALTTGRALAEENRALRAELAQLHATVGQLEVLAAENERLLEQLGFSEERGLVSAGAQVIGFEPDPGAAYHVVKIDRGSQQGVAQGSAVMWNGYLVGKVIDTGRNFALVMLASDLRFRAVAVGAANGATGLVRGGLAGGLTMDMIPPDAEIAPGELVMTSGLDGALPRDLPLGVVSEVTQTPGSVFQTASIRTFFEAAELRNLVLVVEP